MANARDSDFNKYSACSAVLAVIVAAKKMPEGA
jgi:hypothetical protein